MERTFDIFHKETLCGTAWARTIESGNKREICIECFLRFHDVPAIGLRKVRKKSLHTLSGDGKPRRIEIVDDRGGRLDIDLSGRAMTYDKKSVPLDGPIDFALEGNMIPLTAIWWEALSGRETGTFRTLVCESGAVFDYQLTKSGGNLVSSLKETFVLDAQGEISEVRLAASDFVIRRGRRPFPKRTFTALESGPVYRAPRDIVIEDTLVAEDGKEVEATVARPLEGQSQAVAVFIGGTGIYGRHGITPTIDIGTHQLLDGLARENIASVRYEKFDRRVNNPVEAEGAIDFDTLVADAHRWLEWLDSQEWADGLPRILIGHSMGGTVALALSAGNPGIAASLLLNSPGRPLADVIAQQIAWHQSNNPASETAETEAQQQHQALVHALSIDEEWTAENVDPRLLPVKHKRRFLKSVFWLDPCDFVPRGEGPMIIVQGTRDAQVSLEDARLLANAAQDCGRPAELIEADGLDHLLKRNPYTGLRALDVYRDRRRRVPVALIRRLAEVIRVRIGLSR